MRPIPTAACSTPTVAQALRARGRGAVVRSAQGDTSASRSPSRPSSTRFQAKPYGWDLASIEVLIAFLVGTSKVTLTVDGNVLKRSEVATALRNTQKHAHAVVAPQKTFDERKVAAFRKFCTDFFDEGNTPKDPLELARHGADKLKAKRDELKATVDRLQVPVRGSARRTDRPARPSGRQARRLVPDRLQPWRRPARRQGEPDRPDPGVPQRRRSSVIYDEAADLLTTHSSNLGYLPSGSDAAVRSGAGRPERLPRQPHGAAQAGHRRAARPDRRASSRRTEPTSSRPSRAARPRSQASAYYAEGDTGRPGERARGESTRRSPVCGHENQIALIRETGIELRGDASTRGCSTSWPHPPQPATGDGDGRTRPPPKQTVSVKTISAAGVSGVLGDRDGRRPVP